MPRERAPQANPRGGNPPPREAYYYDLEGRFLGRNRPAVSHTFLYTVPAGQTINNANHPKPLAGAGRVKFFLKNFGEDVVSNRNRFHEHICQFFQEMLIRQNILRLHILQYWQEHLSQGGRPEDFFTSGMDVALNPPLEYYTEQTAQNAEEIVSFLRELGVGAIWPLVDHQDLTRRYPPAGVLRGVGQVYQYRYQAGARVWQGAIEFIMDASMNSPVVSEGFFTNFAATVDGRPLGLSSSYISTTSQRGY